VRGGGAGLNIGEDFEAVLKAVRDTSSTAC
jgi:hypothetical protein